MQTLDENLIKEMVDRIVATLHPKAIYLYGSHAYGHPHQDSDVDLCVVVENSDLPSHKRATEAYRALRGLFLPAEIKVVTREEFERRAQWISSIERVVQEKGQVLYEAS
jgi:predicted nucleotidyltransferase